MRNRFQLLTVTLAVVLGVLSVPAGALDKGSVAPNFPVGRAGVKDLESLRGKVVVIDFWAHWCKPCKKELPVLQKLYAEYKDKGLVVLGVSVDREDDKMKKFIKDMEKKDGVALTFPIVRDEGQGIAGKYSPETMPSSFIIDKKGRVEYVHSGFRGDYRSGDGLALENRVRALLGLGPLK